MPTETELAYIAGQLDADGSISLANVNGYTRVDVAIYSQDREMLEWIQSLLGGNVWPCGRVLQWKPSKKADFLLIILPYLKTKRRQAELALRKDRTVEEMKELNGRLPKLFR